MVHIPASAAIGPLNAEGTMSMRDEFEASGYKLTHQGKVRDTYRHPDFSDQLFVVATDRLSIFDFVLPALVMHKGAVLTALTHFWLTTVLAGYDHHLVRPMYGIGNNRTLIVRRLLMQDFELIFRHHIGGSVWKEYEQKGTIAGERMPAGLTKWQKLDSPAFTPSTKAKTGHDENITVFDYVRNSPPGIQSSVHRLRSAYGLAYQHALERGILILDTKLEANHDGVIGDETFTPDSSRFTTVADYEKAIKAGRDPIFYDKEPVRVWGRSVETPFGVSGINNLDPENPDHLDFVASTLVVPEDVLSETTDRYLRIFELLTGTNLRQYQAEWMKFAD